jgi:hypothetical protein
MLYVLFADLSVSSIPQADSVEIGRLEIDFLSCSGDSVVRILRRSILEVGADLSAVMVVRSDMLNSRPSVIHK